MASHISAGHDMSIHLIGTPYEQGKQQGEKAAILIANNVHSIKEKISKFNISQTDYEELLKENLNFLKANEPAMMEEMHGIADGSKIALADIELINLPLYFVMNWLSQECSSILARGFATFDGKTYLVKNRDMANQLEHVILHREYSNTNKLIEINGAGIITYPGNGLNSHGLALATSGVWSKRMNFDLAMINKSHSLINSHLILERCKSVDEAVEYLKTEKRMTGMNFVIADREKALAVEATQDCVYVTDTNRDIIVRTNHYLTSELSCLNRSPEEYSSTYKRYERANEYLHKKYGNVKFQDMLEIASDHQNGFQDSLCRHDDDTNESKTVYSSIIVLEDYQVWTALCNPCEALRISYI